MSSIKLIDVQLTVACVAICHYQTDRTHASWMIYFTQLNINQSMKLIDWLQNPAHIVSVISYIGYIYIYIYIYI